MPGGPGATVDWHRYAIFLLNSMLGSGMSSRLFQTVREDQRPGLLDLLSEVSPFRDTGALSIYAGTSAEELPRR